MYLYGLNETLRLSAVSAGNYYMVQMKAKAKPE